MSFSSISFLYFFLPSFFILYFAVPFRFKNAVLFFSSIVFYAWGEQLLAILFLCSIFIGWLTGILLNNFSHSKKSKLILIFSIIYDIGILFYFKYMDFFISSVNYVFKSIPLLNIVLPIGISFYTFQLISYKIDVYKGSVNCQKNFINFGAYISMFPQLIAGPIVRYSDVEKQLTQRTITVENIVCGIKRFIIGLSKKVLIANMMAEICTAFSTSPNLSVLYFWLYGISFTLQIYFDFSGYSDMAIGLGKILGFDFCENFNFPYISKTITEFWRRWHISLGSWFKDYVYIPLGGNRKGIIKQILNILIVWALTGLWHGASWNFVLWGLYFAFILILEKLFLYKIINKSKFFSHIYSIFLIIIGFIIFDSTTLSDCFFKIYGLFNFKNYPVISSETIYYLKSYGIVLITAIIFSTNLPSHIFNKLNNNKTVLYIDFIIYPLLLILCTASLINGSFNPFLYFRF